MNYYMGTIRQCTFEDAVARAREALSKEGFGVITEIDVRETLKRKLDIGFRNYVILGACNPALAHKALTAEDKIGVMLPCNVIVQELESGGVEIAAMNPAVAMKSVQNDELGGVAEDVTQRLARVINSL